MSEPEGYYQVGLSRTAVYVRVIGLATMYTAACVRDFVERMLEEGYAKAVFDLEDCCGMDSTFLGVLAGVATYDGADDMPSVIVVNAAPPNRHLLESVGLTELIEVCDGRIDRPDIRLESLRERTREEERLDLVRSAHEKLVQIDDRNEEVFGAFLNALKAQMDRQHNTEE